ncbi:MAG TPA: ADP-ribose diphosphatase [Nitrosomonas sp.]|nr:ADP-ribose diphosphatase [Burkholderiales bacterium]HQU61985.1 ADP-ribose diphosphatase [Nitrosomonas sp.]
MIDKNIEIIEKITCYQGFFRIDRYRLRHRLFNGEWGSAITRELFERGHAAAVLPYDPIRDEVILIEQFRIGALNAPGGPWLTEIIAGIIEENEAPEDVVKRESVEEANCIITDLVPLYDYLVSPGGMTERIALYCGRVDTTHAGGIHGAIDEGEDIKVHVVSRETALSYLQTGRINSASAIIALQWLALNREKLLRQWMAS